MLEGIERELEKEKEATQSNFEQMLTQALLAAAT